MKTRCTSTFLLILFFVQVYVYAQDIKLIAVETKKTTLLLTVNSGGKIFQSYFGEKLNNQDSYKQLKHGRHEAYIPSGMDNLFEPAIRVIHHDGNPSLVLKYADHKTEKKGDKVITEIHLKDPVYPVEVVLYYTAYVNENVITTRTEIKHAENKPVVLTNFASSMLHFDAPSYWLTQFHGNHNAEMKMQESQLTSGIKVIDSKLGARANMYQSPVFFLSLNKPSDENTGELIAGTLAWTGNFQFLFEVDEQNSLRLISGMNPFGSDYKLPKGKTFVTPEFIFTYSNQGKGLASRNLHDWARKYSILDADKPRIPLLNNWEATYFDFNEQKLESLLDDTKKLGVDLFLLDDGWFSNKYPRNNDKTGLGDWEVSKSKLPNGIGHLVKEADKRGVKFGIWLEPEMINPKSALYEKHPDWVLKLNNREEHYYRNQLILDLINPKVQDFVYNVVVDMMKENPGIAYIKWDCNRMMTNTASPYLKENQSHVFIEYTRSLYKILDRIREKYPHLPMMLCSGGGGRTDYGALKYFNEFWPSDNTDPVERIFIQWGYSYFFPSLSVVNHITSRGKQSLKFKTDVAMMGKMGYDMRLINMTPAELEFSQNAVKTYKKIEETITQGDMYRLVSPYEEPRAVLMYVDKAKNKSVLFAYTMNTRDRHVFNLVRLQGLDPDATYTVQEINLMPGAKSSFFENNKSFTGDYLMKVGMNVSTIRPLTSAIFEITKK